MVLIQEYHAYIAKKRFVVKTNGGSRQEVSLRSSEAEGGGKC